jgi:hypothetical protein
VKVEDSCTDLLPVNAGVPQGSVLDPLLYLLYTADLPTSPESTMATFADETAILATDPDPSIASEKPQTSLLAIQHWLTKWRLKANSSKCTHVTFTTRRATCPGVHIYTTSNFPKQRKLSIRDYTWTDASPGISTSLPNGNILASHFPKCTGCWAVSPNSLWAINF